MNINPLNNAKIGVATTYGKPYFKFSKSLKNLNLKYDSILPTEILDYEGHLVLTTFKEVPSNCKIPLLHEDLFEKHITVISGKIIQKLRLGLDDELIIGIDPGKRIGLSVSYYGKEIEKSFHGSIEKTVLHIITIMGELRARRKVIKIGNGDMEIAKKIGTMLNLKFCSSFELEYVDESKTSPKIKNFNSRGKRDMLSARYISQRDGLRQLVLPLSITG